MDSHGVGVDSGSSGKLGHTAPIITRAQNFLATMYIISLEYDVSEVQFSFWTGKMADKRLARSWLRKTERIRKSDWIKNGRAN